MATHDYILDNATGANFRSDLNNALAAIVSNNSSSSEPSTKYAYQWWADTNEGVLKIRNSANDGWVTLLQLDGTLTLEDGSNSAPALGFRDDLNTGIFSSAADNLDITTGGTTRVNVSSTGINVTGTVIDDGATHDGDVTFTGASANIVFDKSDNALEFADNAKAVFGTGSDLTISHDGSNSIINDSGTGELQLQRAGNTILTLDANGVSVTDPDGAAQVNITGFEGGGAKVVLTADEGDDNGDTWELQSHATSQNLNFRNDSTGSSTVKWNLTTDGDVTQTGHLDLPDSKQIKLGTGDDLTLVHDGSNSTIDSNTGTFIIRSDGGGLKLLSESNIILRDNDDTTNLIRCINGGQIELYHNGSKKAETVSGGFTVTGTCTATAFSGDGSALTGITGTATTINNNGVSRVITGSETANTLEGQANFTFNGNEVKVTQTTSSSDVKFILRNSNTPATGSMRLEFHHGTGSTEGTNRFRYGFIEGIRQDSSNAGALGFGTKADNASAPAEKMRLTKNGRLGIGTTSPSHLFTVVDGTTSIGFSRSGNNPQIVLDANNLSNAGIIQVDESSGGSLFTFSTKTTSGTLQQNFRINMAGDVTTTSDVTYTRATSGFTARKGDSVNAARGNGYPLEINRTGSDGGLINFFQDGSQEGNISVSGSSVSYNGGHLSRWSQLKGVSTTDKSARPTIYQGTVMSNLDDLCVWHHADELYDKGDELNQSIPEGKKIGDVKTPAHDEINQQLNMTKISDTEGDKDVAGVFWAWDDDDDEIVNDFYISMTGDMVIRVAESTTVARGDLLISAGDGTAKPQDDDIVRSSTIAKIISTNHTATYADGSKAYPCVLMAC